MPALMQRPDDWSVVHEPAATAAAVAAKAAVVGEAHRCTSITASVAGTGAAAALKVYLRDGATGAGAILWTGTLSSAANLADKITLPGLNIKGTPGNAMTLETAAGGGANTTCSVTLTGWTGV